MRSHHLPLLRLSDDGEHAGQNGGAAGGPRGMGGAPPLPAWRASKRSWRVPPPNAETWRLLSRLPQRVRHGILSMADALERLREPIAASEAPSLVCRVSRLSRWHRTAARAATLRLLVFWQPQWGQQSVDEAFGAFRDPPHPSAKVYNVCVEAAVPPSGPGIHRLDGLPQLAAARAPGNPGLLGIVNDMALSSSDEDGSEAPHVYRAVFRASYMPDLPRLRTLRLLFFRRIYLAGLSPSVRKVNIYLSRQLAGEQLAPLASLTAHTLAELHLTANYSSQPQDEVIIDVQQMCRSASSISINVRALGLPVPPPRLPQRLGPEAAFEPSAAWSVGEGASVWDLGVPMPAPGMALPGAAPISADDLKHACLARVQHWALEGAAEYVEILCKHVRFHYATDGASGQQVPLPLRQMAAVADESWAYAADALALDLASHGASAFEVDGWAAAAAGAYWDAQAGGAEEAEQTDLVEVNAAWRLDREVLQRDLQQWQAQREQQEREQRVDGEVLDAFGQPLTGLDRILEKALGRVAPAVCGAVIVASCLVVARLLACSRGDERYDEDPLHEEVRNMKQACGRIRRPMRP